MVQRPCSTRCLSLYISHSHTEAGGKSANMVRFRHHTFVAYRLCICFLLFADTGSLLKKIISPCFYVSSAIGWIAMKFGNESY